MKRVLQISKYYYPFIGGIEQVARDISTAIRFMPNVEQKIICFNEDAKKDGYVTNKNETVHDRVDGVEVIRCGYQLKLSSQAISLNYKKELKRVMDEFQPEIVILHYPNPFVTHFLLKYKKRDFKLLVYWHLDITKQKILKHLFYLQNISLIRRADKILGATPIHLEKSEFTTYFGDKKTILPYCIDEKNLILNENELKKAQKIKNEHKNEKIALFIGRHVPYKGLEYLIKASRLLESTNVHFYIAGVGELTESLKKMAKGDSKIEFLGKITDADRRSYLYAADIFCFPSITRNEAFGLALAEAMYFGKPAVTFNIPGSGVNYVNLNGVTGIECPNQDISAYAEAIKKLCEDEYICKKYGMAARKRVVENFTMNSFANNLNQLLENL